MKTLHTSISARLLMIVAVLIAVPVPLLAAQLAIPGTSVSMDVPAGFTVSRTFSGLESAADGSSITVAELPAEAYSEVATLFSDFGAAKSGFLKRGISIERKVTQTVDGKPIPVLTGSQAIAGGKVGKYMALFGGEVTVLITFNVLDPRTLTPAIVEKVVSSIRLSSAPTLKQKVERLPFSFNAVVPFHVIDTIAGSGVGLSTVQGTDPTGLRPLIIISSATGAIPANTTPTQLAQQLLRATRGSEAAEITLVKEVVFYGGPGIYLEAVTGDRRIVQYVKTQGDHAMVILTAQGAKAEMEKVMDAVSEIATSVSAR